MLTVKKFGGSSLATPERLLSAARLCADEYMSGNQTLTVVSARGDTTDELLSLAESISPDCPPRERAALLSTGEQQSAALMAIQLSALGLPAISLTGRQAGIVTEAGYESAEIKSIDTHRFEALLSAGFIPVVCGFQGADPEGDTTTLGRGGSDTTAVALAAALNAGRCEIYTDVDGVYTADPRIVPTAEKHSIIDYASMLALAEAGAQVLHPSCVRLARDNNIRLFVLSALEKRPGTELSASAPACRLCGVAVDSEARLITALGTAADEQSYEEIINALSDRGIAVKYARHGPGVIKIKTAPEKLSEAACIIHRILV